MKKFLLLFLAFVLLIPCSTDAFAANAPTAADSTDELVLSTVNMRVDGVQFELYAYNFGRENYVRLRDIAYLLNSSEKQFSIGYDNETKLITLNRNSSYVSLGIEMLIPTATSVNAASHKAKLICDGVLIDLDVYCINGTNYVNLRTLAELIDFSIVYDSVVRTNSINTALSYNPDSEIAYFTRYHYNVTFLLMSFDGAQQQSSILYHDDTEFIEKEFLELYAAQGHFANFAAFEVIEFERTMRLDLLDYSDAVIAIIVGNIALEMTYNEYLAYIEAGANEQDIFNFVSEESLRKYQDALEAGHGGANSGVPLG